MRWDRDKLLLINHHLISFFFLRTLFGSHLEAEVIWDQMRWDEMVDCRWLMRQMVDHIFISYIDYYYIGWRWWTTLLWIVLFFLWFDLFIISQSHLISLTISSINHLRSHNFLYSIEATNRRRRERRRQVLVDYWDMIYFMIGWWWRMMMVGWLVDI